ncbi:MAG: hypothetical protein R2753_00255 [Chitinophagales bacterium]
MNIFKSIMLFFICFFFINVNAQHNFKIPQDGAYRTFSDLRLGLVDTSISYEIDTITDFLFKDSFKRYMYLRNIEANDKEYLRSTTERITKPKAVYYAIIVEGKIYINTEATVIGNENRPNNNFGTSWRNDVYIEVSNQGKFLYFEMDVAKDWNTERPFKRITGSSEIKGYIVNLNAVNGQIFKVTNQLLEKLLITDDLLYNEYKADERKDNLDKRRDYIIKFSEKNIDQIINEEAFIKKLSLQNQTD